MEPSNLNRGIDSPLAVKMQNKLLIPMIMCGVLAAGGIGFGVWGVMQNNAKNAEISNLKIQVKDANGQVTVLETEKVETTKDDGTTVTITDTAAMKNFNLALDKHKLLNGEGKYKFRLEAGGYNVFRIWQDVDQTGDAWNIDIDWNEMKLMYNLKTNKTGVEHLTNIKLGFDKEVVDIYACGFGQAVGHETFFFLMEDGTVEYMPFEKALTEGIKSYGKLPNVEQVVRFERAIATGGEFGATNDNVAQRADGDYYNLYTVLYAN